MADALINFTLIFLFIEFYSLLPQALLTTQFFMNLRLKILYILSAHFYSLLLVDVIVNSIFVLLLLDIEVPGFIHIDNNGNNNNNNKILYSLNGKEM